MSSYSFDPKPYKEVIGNIITSVEKAEAWNAKKLRRILADNPKDGNRIFSKDQIVQGYKLLVKDKVVTFSQLVLDRIKMKPTRTISGVAPITVLTKPFPCPGRCIYCPNDVRMPKSYLRDEPGAQRAERNAFHPYLQTYNRMQALSNTGHHVDKVELIILGGTWSFYPDEYQIWFVKECFRAINDFGHKDDRDNIKTDNIFENAHALSRKTANGRNRGYNELVTEVVRNKGLKFFAENELSSWQELEEQQEINTKSKSRCVGLVIETRPDYIDETEAVKIRRLGATKVQIGVQSLSDRIQKLNKRGHGKKETAAAFKYLRLMGFKIHAHWMPNQLGATVKSDISDYKKLFAEDYCPDELKIYPTSVIANTELNTLYKKGVYAPYTFEQLVEVLTEAMKATPRFCRLTRVIRDIPSTDIVAGNKLTNFRQIAENKLKEQEERCQCIRCREIKSQRLTAEDLEIEELQYKTTVGTEHFLSFKTKSGDKIAAFLRLFVPNKNIAQNHFYQELKNSAIIREVHVYGQAVQIGSQDEGKAQHLGLGKKLIVAAENIAKSKGYNKIAVISAIGTREYYSKLGYSLERLYQWKSL